MNRKYDLVIIGGGFYGLRIALHASETLAMGRIAVVERETTMMSRASYINQARVHNGYHYPRSILTAYRSRVNFPRFVGEYAEAIDRSFEHYYAVSRRLSKTSARQFEVFCARIGARCEPANPEVVRMFNAHMVQGVFLVDEPAFDAGVLRSLLLERIQARVGIELLAGVEAMSVSAGPTDSLNIETSGKTIEARQVISAGYSGINKLHAASGLPIVGMQNELGRIALVRPPAGLESFGVTVMDGPFFSFMPFPSGGLHTLTHVRHTPVRRWHDSVEGTPKSVDLELSAGAPSGFKQMYADAVRYLPALREMEFKESMIEVKTVLSRSMSDDSRPIYFSPNHGLKNYTVVMGGKLDNIYDVLTELDRKNA